MIKWPTNPEGIQRANKEGITFVACKRKRKKAIVSISLTEQGRMYANTRAQGDMARFLVACKGKTTLEAQEIADKLHWSRDAVLIYKARAEERGHVTSWKDSDERVLQAAQAIIEKRKMGNLEHVIIMRYDNGMAEAFIRGQLVKRWASDDKEKPKRSQHSVTLGNKNYFIQWTCKD
jgi:hypothetical protein